MADLESCYFCGEGPNEALDSYGVVPATFDPSPSTQRSVVLCPSCRDKLTAVMKSAVQASEAGSPARETSGGHTAGEPSAGDAGGAGSGGARGGDAGDADTDEEGAGDQGGLSIEQPGADETAGGNAGAAATGGSTSDDAGSDLADATADRGREESSAGGSTGPDDGAPTMNRSGSPSEASDDGEAMGPSATGGEEPSPPSTGEELMGSNSEAYRQVIRLLQNREFPVDRAEIEDVAASAYQISPETCHRVIDEAIERDLLAERDGDIVPKE